ncbi:crosslink repair DNA glycosylase YcaQ family protein [Acinetobacter puyangensis]|uniref:Winged helix-turn-helix domain-containing protein n=1 Tax=Acinetobacter puyangensis TaxID=1096779 RepID=A0A240EFI9_9GAMM|nr:crosslink repair DNA glycosylase YcaQ family protein [Acinetobacter puyangensis]SNX46735.1 hypothetical protein SAMN05421731_11720 [Acinetobacter puyangensis]
MKDISILKRLRSVTLDRQGLLQPSRFGQGKLAVQNAVEHLGYIQIDTLSIVERAHHHTLWTRIPDYQPEYLDALVTERKVFEYWFHAASYLPMKDFRYVLTQMLAVKHHPSHYYNADPKIMKYVMDKIRAEGPKKSRDFESESKKAGSWWNWKPTKLALERLFMQGDLMICERHGMQKTYDVCERVLPQNVDTTAPSPIEFAEYIVKTYLRAYGFTTFKQIIHLKTGAELKKNVVDVLNAMLEQGVIEKINVLGIPDIFVQSGLMDQTFNFSISSVRLLSPFDNVIIHRERAKQIFDFDFRLECYTPKEKRHYGYFCLPILFGDTFIGRVDCKAHRKEQRFELIQIHIENMEIEVEKWIASFIVLVRQFATFNGCQVVTLTKVSPLKFEKIFQQSIQAC